MKPHQTRGLRENQVTAYCHPERIPRESGECGRAQPFSRRQGDAEGEDPARAS
ncbi:MAG: hypothetical protein JWN07_1147 [Hyphomicrobiales bacterium]|nr:hypothetical protein [Hyphomicrobiales bacterium]